MDSLFAEKDKLFIFGCQNGLVETVESLLKNPNVDPAMNENIAIYIASLEGQLEIVKLLLQDKRVDPTIRDNVPLSLAVAKGHILVVKELLKNPNVQRVAKEKMSQDIINAAVIKGFEDGNFEKIKPFFDEGILTVYETEGGDRFAKLANY